MRKVVVLLLAALFSACSEPEETDGPKVEIPPVEVLPVEVLPIKSDRVHEDRSNTDYEFKSLEFDKAHIIRSREDFIDKTAYVRDSLSVPDVDFGEYSVIAATGLAASVVDTIIPVYSVCQGEYILDLDIKPTTMRAACKWNLMLKVPKIDDSVHVECRIRTADKNSLADLPEYFCVFRDYYYCWEHTEFLSDSFMIIYEPENKKYVLDAVNRDDSCRMYTEGGSPYFETYAALEDSYGKELLQSFLFSCNYENVISPIEDKIVYVSPAAYYIVSNSVSTYGYHYLHPVISVEYEKLDILQPLIDYMKADVKVYLDNRWKKCFLICDWKKFCAYNMRSVVNRSYAADERIWYGYDFVSKPDADGQEKRFYE